MFTNAFQNPVGCSLDFRQSIHMQLASRMRSFMQLASHVRSFSVGANAASRVQKLFDYFKRMRVAPCPSKNEQRFVVGLLCLEFVKMQLETEHAIGQYAAKTELCVQHTASHVAAIILRSVQLSCLFYSNKGLGLCALLKRYSK